MPRVIWSDDWGQSGEGKLRAGSNQKSGHNQEDWPHARIPSTWERDCNEGYVREGLRAKLTGEADRRPGRQGHTPE